MILAGDRDAALLHRLQQRRLGARAGAVDLVGHQQLAEHRAGNEAERAPAGLAFLQHFRAEDVGRHQIGRALDALVVEPEHGAERLDQPRLGQAGDADQQRMAAGEQGDQGLIDHLALAEDDSADALAHRLRRWPSASISATAAGSSAPAAVLDDRAFAAHRLGSSRTARGGKDMDDRDKAQAELARLAAAASRPAAGAKTAPRDCGYFDIHIARDGSWFYRGSPIKRMTMVRLFAAVLERDAEGLLAVRPRPSAAGLRSKTRLFWRFRSNPRTPEARFRRSPSAPILTTA